MAQRGNALSRNPNMCACCSSLADGLEQDELLPALEPRAERLAGLSPFDQPKEPDAEPDIFCHAFGE